MKTYISPQLVVHGAVSDLTAVEGASQQGDTLIGSDGEPIPVDTTGSVDGCTTSNFDDCNF